MTGPDILGGEADVEFDCLLNTTGTAVMAIESSGFRMQLLDTDPIRNAASAWVTWDGADNSATLDPTGLGGIDLTAGGTKDSLVLAISESPTVVGAAVSIEVYTDAESASATWGPTTGLDGVFVIPLALGWAPIGQTGGADFTDVGAISVRVVSTGETDRPMGVDSLATGRVASATMTDTVAVDGNSDAHANPGDTIEYTVTIDNPLDLGSAVADDAVFTLTPTAAGPLVVGSVTTTQGTVTTGNGAGDTTVAVAVGEVANGESATITFRVVAQEPGSLANQGVLEYEVNMLEETPLHTSTETDDPDTAEFSDDTITAVVEPVVAADDTYTTPVDTPLTGNVLTNDIGPGPLTAALTTTATHGSVVVNADGTFTYTPQAGFVGTDTFAYQATANTVTPVPADVAGVTITVGTLPEPTVANPDGFDTDFGAPVTGNVLTNDAGAGTLTAEVVDEPADGTLALDPDGTFTYTPDAGFSGTDSFTYRAISSVSGPTGPSAAPLALPADVATVVITVAAAPVTTPPPTTPPPTTPGSTLPPPLATDPPTPPTIPGTLPATGANGSGMAITALLVLGLGAALTLTVRRRRHA